MRIGIDFDNTIVDYEGAFHAAAMERGLVTADLPKTKNSVRDFLNSAGRKDDFTALQGYVYGTRMNLAKVYPGFREFVAIASASRNDLFIVSHKTQFPLLGPKYDMHEAARVFLAGHRLSADDAVPGQNIFFEETKEQKIDRAAALHLDVFIDDLPEILTMPGLPDRCRRILFAPQGSDALGNFEQCRCWDEITDLLFGARDE
jgi:hypothetical protein